VYQITPSFHRLPPSRTFEQPPIGRRRTPAASGATPRGRGGDAPPRGRGGGAPPRAAGAAAPSRAAGHFRPPVARAAPARGWAALHGPQQSLCPLHALHAPSRLFPSPPAAAAHIFDLAYCIVASSSLLSPFCPVLIWIDAIRLVETEVALHFWISGIGNRCSIFLFPSFWLS